MLDRERLARTPVASRARFVSVTVPASTRDALAFLDAAPEGAPRVLVEDPERGLAFAGTGAARIVTADGESRFTDVDAALRRAFARLVHEAPAGSPAGPRALGGFAFFDDHASAEAWAAFPGAWFVVPRALLTVTPEGAWLTLTATAESDVDARRVLARLRTQATDLATRTPPAAPAAKALARLDPEDGKDREAWTGDVRAVVDALRAGRAEKVVLARAVDARLSRDARVTDALRAFATASPGCARFLVEPAPGAAFLGATPETLVAVTGHEATTAALASTTRRGTDPAEDDALAARLMASRKERREHAFVVDAIRAGLAPLADAVTVEDAPTAARFAHVQHLRTRITAHLKRAGDLLRVAGALHPTPAVGGTPRRAALAHVRAVERTPRGWYAGTVGWVGPEGDGTLLVAIRSALVAGGLVRAFAGAGILADSDPEAEFRETASKLAPMVRALGGDVD